MIVFWLTVLYSTSSGQTCTHKNLSRIFDYTTSIKRYPRADDVMDSCDIKVLIRKKEDGRLVQTVPIKSNYMFSSDFDSCKDVRSYVTGYNAKQQAVDNDFGNLIVGDFNFDGREDFAVKRDSGGNGGPFYDFFLQDRIGKFVKSLYLSKEVEFFPSKINKRKLSLTTYVHAGVCGLGEHIYQYNVKTQKWKQLSYRIINVCK